MSTITTVVPPFTKVPDINDTANFENDTNVFLNEINQRYIDGNQQVSEINVVAQEINQKAEQVASQPVSGGYSQDYINKSQLGKYTPLTAIGGETNIVVGDNTDVIVYKNNIRLDLTTDYTLNGDGVTIDFVSPLVLNDFIQVWELNLISNEFINNSDVIDNLVSSNTDKPLSANQGKILSLQDLSVVHDITVDGDYALTDEQNKYGRIEITDTNPFLTTTRNIIVDNNEHTFLFVNSTAQILTVKTSGGSGIAVNAGEAKELRNDTVDVIEYEAGLSFLGTFDYNNFFLAQDQKTNGTNGGGSSAGEQTRVLNTVLVNNGSFASLSSNQITLQAGTYYIEASAPCSQGNRHKINIYNVSDANTEIVGENAFTSSSNTVTTRSGLKGVLTVASTKIMELRHYIQTAVATDGLGINLSDGNVEVYSEIKIWKVA